MHLEKFPKTGWMGGGCSVVPGHLYSVNQGLNPFSLHIFLHRDTLNSSTATKCVLLLVKHIYTGSFVPQMSGQLWVCMIPQSLKLETLIWTSGHLQ